MNIAISVIILLIVLFFFVDGIRRGLLRAVFEIIGLVVAFFCAYYFGHIIAAELAGSVRISHAALLYFFAFVVFLAVIIVFHLLGLLLQKIVSATVLGPVDRLGGAVLGAVKGVLVVSLLLVVLAWLPLPEAFKADVRENRLAAAIHPVLPSMYDFFIRRTPLRPGEAADDMEMQRKDSQETQRRRTA